MSLYLHIYTCARVCVSVSSPTAAQGIIIILLSLAKNKLNVFVQYYKKYMWWELYEIQEKNK